MNKFKVAELINNLRIRIEELESRFKINNNYNCHQLFIENTRLALGIDDPIKTKGCGKKVYGGCPNMRICGEDNFFCDECIKSTKGVKENE